MFGINIPRFGRSRFPFSKPGGFNVAFFRYQHFGSTRPVGKKDAGLLSSSPGQCVSSAFGELEGNHSRPPGAD